MVAISGQAILTDADVRHFLGSEIQVVFEWDDQMKSLGCFIGTIEKKGVLATKTKTALQAVMVIATQHEFRGN